MNVLRTIRLPSAWQRLTDMPINPNRFRMTNYRYLSESSVTYTQPTPATSIPKKHELLERNDFVLRLYVELINLMNKSTGCTGCQTSSSLERIICMSMSFFLWFFFICWCPLSTYLKFLILILICLQKGWGKADVNRELICTRFRRLDYWRSSEKNL